ADEAKLAQPAVLDPVKTALPEAEGTSTKPERQGQLPERRVPRAARRQADRVQVAVAVVGRAIVFPGHVRQHRRIGEEPLVPEKLLDDGAARVAASAKTGRLETVRHEPLVDVFQLREY